MKSNQPWRQQYSDKNPFAPPDRRARLTQKCLKDGVRPSVRDDQTTWELFQFRKRRHVFHDRRFRLRPTEKQLSIEIAFQLRGFKRRVVRMIIEAYLLAGAEDQVIAARLGLPEDVIKWFRLAFFDVERLRSAPLQIIYQIIGVLDPDGHSQLDTYRLWKLVGLALGAKALDLLIGSDSMVSKTQDGLSEWLLGQSQLTMRLKCLLAAHRLDLTDTKQIQALFRFALHEQSQQKGAEAPLNTYERHAQGFLADLAFSFGSDGEVQHRGTLLGDYDSGAAELRDDEVQQVATGRDLPHLKDLPKKLPPPSKIRPSPFDPKSMKRAE